MAQPIRLTSAQNDRVKAVVRLLREQKERRETGLFVAEGRRQITRALAAGLPPHEFYCCPDTGQAADLELRERIGNTGAAVFAVTAALMQKMAYRENPETTLAVFPQPTWTLATLNPQALGRSSAQLWLVAVGISKPGNLGAMARSAAAAGAWGVLVADAPVDPFNPNAIHASTGAVFTLPVVSGTSEEVREFLHMRHVQIIAAVPGAPRTHISVDLKQDVALVIGAEDTGLDEPWRRAADQAGACVSIPMAGGVVDSLNAANAAAILLFEAVRQRLTEPKITR